MRAVSYLLTMSSLLSLSGLVYAIEISGSPFATENAPIPEYIKPQGEKVIVIDPRHHFYGAYDAKGKLVRWGIATAGSDYCKGEEGSCRTTTGTFRIFSAGTAACHSRTYPKPGGGAPMPYCMFFNGGEALHASSGVTYGNGSHGCVRVHYSDAKWLRYQFITPPSAKNNYKGTKIIVKPY